MASVVVLVVVVALLTPEAVANVASLSPSVILAPSGFVCCLEMNCKPILPSGGDVAALLSLVVFVAVSAVTVGLWPALAMN